jgi:hypothetical protein
MEIKNKLIDLLPYDVIINNIIPYTYNLQNKEHLKNIRFFKKDYKMLYDLTAFSYNDTIILTDLIRFCNNNIAPIYDIEEKYENILRRHFLFKNKTKWEIKMYVFRDFHKRLLNHTERKLFFLYSLLTPEERYLFHYSYNI